MKIAFRRCFAISGGILAALCICLFVCAAIFICELRTSGTGIIGGADLPTLMLLFRKQYPAALLLTVSALFTFIASGIAYFWQDKKDDLHP